MLSADSAAALAPHRGRASSGTAAAAAAREGSGVDDVDALAALKCSHAGRGSGGGIRRSLSFGARGGRPPSPSSVSDVRYGGTLARTDDPRWLCVAADGCEDIRFCARDRVAGRAWVLGLQRAVALARRRCRCTLGRWSVGQLCWQRARLKLRHEASRRPDAGRCTAQCRALRHGGELERAFAATRIQAAGAAARRRRHRQLVAAMNALSPCCARRAAARHPCRPPNRGRRPRPPLRRRATLDAAASSRRWKRATTPCATRTPASTAVYRFDIKNACDMDVTPS